MDSQQFGWLEEQHFPLFEEEALAMVFDDSSWIDDEDDRYDWEVCGRCLQFVWGHPHRCHDRDLYAAERMYLEHERRMLDPAPSVAVFAPGIICKVHKFHDHAVVMRSRVAVHDANRKRSRFLRHHAR